MSEKLYVGIDLGTSRTSVVTSTGTRKKEADQEYCGAIGALKMSMEMPAEYWEKI